jgi:hypothetical protein
MKKAVARILATRRQMKVVERAKTKSLKKSAKYD